MFIHHQQVREHDEADKFILIILKDCVSRCNQNKRKTVVPHITHNEFFYYNYLQFPHNWLASYSKCLPSFPFSLLSYNLTEAMPREFQESGKSRSGGSEKDHYFFNILKWQHKLVAE